MCSKVYNNPNLDLGPPTRIPTPYGGRLEWVMPGNNKLIAHLKDSTKIRHKKRWSQVSIAMCWLSIRYYYFFALGSKCSRGT